MAGDLAAHWERASKLLCFDVLLLCACDHERFLGYPDGKQRFSARLDSLPNAARTAMFLALPLTGRVDVGLHGFFRSATGDVAMEVLTRMKAAGFDREAKLMQRAIDAFGQPYPASWKERHEHFSRGFHSVGQTRPDPPTNIDRALRALDRSFRADTRYAAALAIYCEADAELRTWLVGQEPNLSEQDRMAFLVQRAFPDELISFDTPDETDAMLAAMPEPFRQLFVLHLFQAEVQNGGVHQFFFNSSSIVAPQLREALAAVGLAKTAAVLDRALAMFGPAFPRDVEARRDMFFEAREWNDWDEALQSLSDEVDHDELDRAMIELAKSAGILPGLPPDSHGSSS